MPIAFTLYPPFLHRHFPQVRRRLEGKTTEVVVFLAARRIMREALQPTPQPVVAQAPQVAEALVVPEPILASAPELTPAKPRPMLAMPSVVLPKLQIPTFVLPNFSLPVTNFRFPQVKLPKLVMPAVSLPLLVLPKITQPNLKVPQLPQFPNLSFPNLSLPSLPSLPTIKLPPVALPTVARKPARHAAAWILNGTIAIAILVAVFIFAPQIYYSLAPSDSQPVADLEASQAKLTASPTPSVKPRPLPPQDPNLPTGDWLIIPKIGVRTQLQATENPDDALKTGVWMVPEYGRPGDTDKPVILAAHRFGWKWWWKDDYWKYNSFYLLPDTQPGDIIETIHDQRKYYYQIYAGNEGDEITDYSADMILYTCKFLDSPIRHFRYAKLIDSDANGLPIVEPVTQAATLPQASPIALPNKT